MGLTGGVDDVARLDPRRRGGGRGPLQRQGRDHTAAPLALEPQPGRPLHHLRVQPQLDARLRQRVPEAVHDELGELCVQLTWLGLGVGVGFGGYG